MKKNAIITFDYEVFLGSKTGSVENSVLKPAGEILKVLKRNAAKAIFFVDTTWLSFIKEHSPEDFEKVTQQLKEIVASGSSVELHLHPQWLDAYVESEAIIFNSLKHYTLQSLDQKQMFDLFKNSIDLLQSITGKKITCFRAGGWCIEPFKAIKPVFEAFNIKYEFSAVPGIFLSEGKEYDYDFRNVPDELFYRFNNTVNENIPYGAFIEIPVSTYTNSPFYRLTNKILLKMKKDKVFGDGVSAKESRFDKTVKKAMRLTKGMITLDKMSSVMFRYLLGTHFRKKELVVAVSHPKIVSPQALLNLEYISGRYTTYNADELENLLFNLENR
jgi:peptidoglycan/xylan/chitin deacetylase (PgdA/CDA1 family)